MKPFFTRICIIFAFVVAPCLSFSQLPSFLWSKGFGGSGSDYGRAITMDDSGNIYSIGSFSDTIFFDNISLIAKRGQNIYITKMNAHGDVLWAKQAIGNSGDQDQAITVDKAGNIFITGSFLSDSLSIDTFSIINTNPGSEEIFIGKIDSKGNTLWLTQASGSGRDFAGDIKVDTSGNFVVTGFYESPTIDFGSSPLSKASGLRSIYFVKYDTNGHVLWAKSFGGDWWDLAETISIDDNNNIFLGGGFGSSSITFDSITLTKPSSVTFDLFIAKFNSNGEIRWIRTGAGDGSGEAYKSSVDQDGNVYITGYFSDSAIKLNTITLTSNGDADILLAKYDSLGNIKWANKIGGTGKDLGQGITIDNVNEKVILSGPYNSSTLAFGSKTLTNQGSNDVFVAEYNLSGNFIDAFNIGGSGDENNWGIAGNEKIGLAIAGSFNSDTMNCGDTKVVNHNTGTDDIFIARLYSVHSSCDDVPNNGLVAYYPFNGNAEDASGYFNNGTVYGATLTTDRFGNANSAYGFNGVNNYIDCGNESSLKITGDISISTWLYMDGGSINPRLLSFESPEGNYRITTTGTSNSNRQINCDYGSVSLSTVVSCKVWHHLTFTYANNRAALYIDGVLVVDSIEEQTESLNYTSSLNIGRKAAPTFDSWGGMIDDIRIYNRGLDSSEVKDLYHECGYGNLLAKNDITLTATSEDENAKIKWNVESEQGVESYIIQRSVDGLQFIDIANLSATGNKTYKYIDNIGSNNNSVFFYRIKVNNKDAKTLYTNTVKIVFTKNEIVALYPNPSRDIVHLKYGQTPVAQKASIYNEFGQLVKEVTLYAGTSQRDINIIALKSGMYYIQIKRSNTTVGVTRFIKL